MNTARSDAEIRQCAIAELIQEPFVKRAIDKLKQDYATFCAHVEAGNEAKFYEIKVQYVPMRSYLFPPFTFRIDEGGDIYLCGHGVGKRPNSRTAEVCIPWTKQQRGLFVRAAESPGKKVTLRALTEKPPRYWKRCWKAQSISGEVTKMKSAIRDAIFWVGEGPYDIARYAIDGFQFSRKSGFCITLPVVLSSAKST